MGLSGWFSLLLVGGSCCSVYAATTTGSCPPGWSRFFQDCFYIAENLLPWRAAKMECELFPFQSALPQPKDQISRQKLVTFLQSKGENGHFWLGACDAMSSGKFRWLSGRDKPGTAAGQLDLTGPLDVSVTQTKSGWRAVAVRIAGSFSQLVAKDPDNMARVVCHRGFDHGIRQLEEHGKMGPIQFNLADTEKLGQYETSWVDSNNWYQVKHELSLRNLAIHCRMKMAPC